MTVRIEKPAINVREELADLRKPTGIAGEAMLRAETPQEQFNLIGAGRRNLLINGDFQVWQRGTSFSASYASRPYTADRWQVYTVQSGSSTSVSQSTDVPTGQGFLYSAYFNPSSNTGTIAFTTSVELPVTGNGHPFIEGQRYTLSAWVKTSDPIRSELKTARFSTSISSGQQNCTVTEVKGHSGSGSWEKVIYHIDMPSSFSLTTATHLRLMFGNKDGTLGNTSSAYYTGVQLELGKVATPFEHRSYGEELAACQRYYYRYGGNGRENLVGGSNSSGGFFTIQFPTTMRTAPSFSNGGGFTVNNFSSAGTPSDINGGLTSVNSAEFQTVGGVTYTLGNALLIYETSTNSGNLKFDAEL